MLIIFHFSGHENLIKWIQFSNSIVYSPEPLVLSDMIKKSRWKLKTWNQIVETQKANHLKNFDHSKSRSTDHSMKTMTRIPKVYN